MYLDVWFMSREHDAHEVTTGDTVTLAHTVTSVTTVISVTP